MKICFTCKAEKPLTEFYKNRGNVDGHHGTCKVCHRIVSERWRKANKALVSKRIRAKQKLLRMEVLRHYCGGEPHCQCPGCDIKRIEFLTLDHIRNNGAAHRREIAKKHGRNAGSGTVFLWIKRNGFPPGFQVLCYNCNCGKQYSGKGKCPHEIEKETQNVIRPEL